MTQTSPSDRIQISLDLPTEDYIEHTYYGLDGELKFKCLLKKTVGYGDVECFLGGVLRAHLNHHEEPIK